MPSNKAKLDAGARPERTEVRRISLEGRSIIVAMCVGQLGSLLPHVVVPSILAAFLIPEWHLTGAQAGLLAGSGAAGYMLTVPVLATLTDRIDARKILIAGSAVSALGTMLFGLFATGLWSGAFFNAIAGIGFAGRLHARPQGADRPARARRFIARGDALHVELFLRRRAVVPGLATRRGSLGLARRVPGHGARPADHAVGLLSCCGRSRQNPRRAACWISRRCSATPMRWVLSLAMARIASSSTASAPGWSRSGPLWR